MSRLTDCLRTVKVPAAEASDMRAAVKAAAGDANTGMRDYLDGLMDDLEDFRRQLADKGFDLSVKTMPAEAAEAQADPQPEAATDARPQPELSDGQPPKPPEPPKDIPPGNEPERFVRTAGGSIDWGRIPEAVEMATEGAVKSLPIRLERGNDARGVDHLSADKLPRLQKLGFADLADFVSYVIENWNQVLGQPNGNPVLVVQPGRGEQRKRAASNAVVIELVPHDGYYGVKTIVPDAAESYLISGGKKVLWRRSAPPQAEVNQPPYGRTLGQSQDNVSAEAGKNKADEKGEGDRGFINLFGPRDPNAPPLSQQLRQDMQAVGLAASQPLDRTMRIPFDVFGGVDQRGDWVPGRKLFDGARNAIVNSRFDDDSRFGFLNGFLDRARAGLLDRYGLDDAYVKRERLRTLDERKILARIPELLETLKANNIDAQEAKVLQAVLVGEEVGTAEMEKLAEPIRNAIDAMGAEAVQLGLLDAEAFERNRGKYLHRVYLKHEADDRGLPRLVSSLAGRKRKKIIGDQFKGRGMWMEVDADRLISNSRAAQKGDRFLIFDNLSDRDQGQLEGIDTGRPTLIERAYVRADGDVPAKVSGWTERGGWEVRGQRGGKVVLWRDYTKGEREQMGEIMDARYTIAKTFMLMAHDLATGRFYKDISQNADWAQAVEPAASWKDAEEYSRFWSDPSVQWVKVPEAEIAKTKTKRYGALAGQFVRAEIWRDIQELESLHRPGTWDTLLRQWKLNKTARNPVVHMNNVMSNLVLMDLADVRAVDLVAGVKSLVKKDAYYQEALENGALGSDVVAQELKENVLAPILERLKIEAQGGRGTMQASFGTIGRLSDALAGAAKRADEKMLELYRLEDEAYRMALFIRLREQGFSAELAADEARAQFLDYDIRAPWVNAARRSLLPFISYTYRAVPLLARAIATKPWKLAKYATIAWAANTMGYALMDGDEDEERRSLREEEQGTTWFGAPRMIRMPFGDDAGNPVFLDIRRWIPAGDVFDFNQGQSALPLPAPLQFGGPAMMAAEFLLNKQAFTGQEIRNEYTDDLWDKASKVSDWAWKSWAPAAPWVPGSWYYEKIANAINGARDATGRPYDFASAAASSVGVKLKPQDVEQGMYFHSLEFDRIERELRGEMRTLGRDYERGLISEKAYNAKTEKLFKKFERLEKRRDETFTGEAAE